MSEMTAALIAAAQLEGKIRDFLNAFLVLKSLGVNTHRGFWMPPSHKQYNWYIYESEQA